MQVFKVNIFVPFEVGDIITCINTEEAIKEMEQLNKAGYYTILTDPLGEDGKVSFLNRKKEKKVKTNLTKVKVAEVTHSIFYAPFYVSIEKGYFKKHNIDIEVILTSGADKVSAAVLSGDVNIGFAGAESAIYIYKGGEKDYLQIFSGLTKRDGQFIISRNKIAEFKLDDLIGKEILVGRNGGMPAINFINALDNMHIDKKLININYQVDYASLSGAFIGGTGDYVNLFEPNATMLEANKQGYIVESIGKYSGEMPYTTFYARKSYVKNNKKIINNYIDAINEGLEFVKTHTEKEIAEVIQKQFPDNSLNELSLMIKHYKDADSWLDNAKTSKKSFENLEDVLIKNNLIDSYVPYNKLVFNASE